MRKECIEAVSQAIGRTLTAEQAKNIEQRIREAKQDLARRDRNAYLGMSEAERMTEAGKIAAENIKAEAAKNQQRVALTILKHDAIANYLDDQPGLKLENIDRTVASKHDGLDNFESAEAKAATIAKEHFAKLSDFFDQFGPKMLGILDNDTAMAAVYRELRGTDTGIPDAKAFAKSLTESFEALRKRWNSAGGKIGKLEDWGSPQAHSRSLVFKVGKDKWIDSIDPLLDKNRYINDSGNLMSQAERREFLGKAWESVVYDGLLKDGKPQGHGMRANRNASHRQLHFADADAYLAYHAQFGDQSLLSTIIGHINGLSHDVALIETYGPNPDLQFKTWIETAKKEAAEAGRPLDWITKKAVSAERLYNEVAGVRPPAANERLAQTLSVLRNLNLMKLGSSVFSTFSDDAMAVLTLRMNHISGFDYFMEEVKLLGSKERRVQAKRLGLGLDEMIRGVNRYAVDEIAQGWSGKIGGAVVRSSFMPYMTEVRKQAFGKVMMNSLWDMTRKHGDIASIKTSDRPMLLSRGITETDWQIWRMADAHQIDGNNYLTAQQVMAIPDSTLQAAGVTAADRQAAADRLMSAVLSESSVGIIEPGARERAFMSGLADGELGKTLWQFKTFAVALMMRHGNRIGGMIREGDKSGAAVYFASLIAGTTVAGALGVQLNELASGRDPLPVNDPKFMVKALLKGGSLGIYGDFLSSQTSQHGQGKLASLLGPTAGAVEEIANLTQGNLVELAMGEDTKAGAEAIKFFKTLTPGSSTWYLKAAMDHLIFQDLQESVSPGYLRRMTDRAQREFKQKYYWKPGTDAPQRAPDMNRLWRDK